MILETIIATSLKSYAIVPYELGQAYFPMPEERKRLRYSFGVN